jgi:hypothetical protein
MALLDKNDRYCTLTSSPMARFFSTLALFVFLATSSRALPAASGSSNATVASQASTTATTASISAAASSAETPVATSAATSVTSAGASSGASSAISPAVSAAASSASSPQIASTTGSAPPESQTVAPASQDPNPPIYPVNDTSMAVPEAIRGGLGATILGPTNVPLEQQNPDFLAPPTTDNGDVSVIVCERSTRNHLTRYPQNERKVADGILAQPLANGRLGTPAKWSVYQLILNWTHPNLCLAVEVMPIASRLSLHRSRFGEQVLTNVILQRWPA